MMDRRLFAACCGALGLAVLPVAAAPKKAAKPVGTRKPKLTASQVLDKYVVATGGQAAYDKITSLAIGGTLEMKAQGVSGTFAMKTKSPDKMLVTQTIQNIGDMKQGFDGKVGWSQDPINGLRTLQGPELEQMKFGAAQSGSKTWRQLYTKSEMLGYRKVGAAETYAIRVTPKVGKPIVMYYDTKSFLLLRTDMLAEGPQGTVPTESYTSDYRTVGGVKMPYATRQRVGGVAEVVMKVTEAKVNPAIDDSEFAKPAAPPKPATK